MLGSAPARSADLPEPFTVAVTVDDLPHHGKLPPGMTRLGITESHLATLAAHKVTEAFGFVNAAKLKNNPEGEAVLDAWRKAGHPLGNHTASHLNLERAATLDEWTADVVAGEPAVASRMHGQFWRWLRFPNLTVGTPTKRDGALAWLRGQGYRVADVSLAFSDWSYTDAYARCVTKGDSGAIQAMKDQYYKEVEREIAHMKASSRRVYGRIIPQVLLTHLGGWSAETLPGVLARLDAAGARYITLAQAQSDPAYAQAGGGNIITRTAKEKGISLDNLPGVSPASPSPLDLKTICQ